MKAGGFYKILFSASKKRWSRMVCTMFWKWYWTCGKWSFQWWCPTFVEHSAVNESGRQ